MPQAALARGHRGLLLKAKIHAASVFDRDGIKPLLRSDKELFPRLSHLRLDVRYDGKDKGENCAERLRREGVGLDGGRRAASVGDRCRYPKAESQPCGRISRSCREKWVVERTFSWLVQNRRMSKDYEGLSATSGALVLVR